jgi:hypothetical protein
MRQTIGQQFFGNLCPAPPSAHHGRKSVFRRSTAATVASMIMLPGPVSKAITSRQFGARGQKGEIPNAANVLDDARADRVGEQNPIRKRHERRPLPSRRHVAHAKIRDGGDPVRSAMTRVRQSARWREILHSAGDAPSAHANRWR